MRNMLKYASKKTTSVLMILALLFNLFSFNLGIAYGVEVNEPEFIINNVDAQYMGFGDDLHIQLLNTEYNGEGSNETVVTVVYGKSTPLDEFEQPIEELATEFKVEFKSVIENVYGEDVYTPDFEFFGHFVDFRNSEEYSRLDEDFSNKSENAKTAIPVYAAKKNEIELSYLNKSIKFYWIPEPPKFSIAEDEYYDNDIIEVELFNIVDSEQIAIQGSSVIVDENNNEIGQPIDFKVVFHEEYDPEYRFYKLYGHFSDKNNTDEYIEIGETLEGKTDDELTAIPVDKRERNKITLKYDENTEVVFYWQSTDYWINAHKLTYDIQENPIVDVAVENFTGYKDKLYIELLTKDTETPTTIAKLGYRETIANEDPNSNEEIIRFSYEAENSELFIDFSDKEINNQEILVKLVYDKNDDGIPEKSEQLWEARIDNSPPNPNTWFSGEEIINDVKYYTVKVNFDDMVKGSSISEYNFELKKDDISTGIYPDMIELFGDENTDSYYEVKLYFMESNFIGNLLVVRNIEDKVGHILDEKVTEFHMDIHIKGNVIDQQGSILSDIEGAEIILVPEDLDLSMIDFEYESIYDYVDFIHIDGNGMFDRWIEPGTYKAVSLEIWDENGEKSISIDKTIEVPYMADGEVFNFDIQIPDDNVFGNVHREDGEFYVDKLLIIDTSYLSYIEDKDVQNDEIFRIFGKTVETNEDGSFSIHLAPGEYLVIGKQLGFTHIKPEEEYIFTVNNDESTYLNKEIIFPLTNIFGNIIDQKGNPLQNGHIVIVDDNDGFYETMTDPSGNFGIALDDGNYYLAAVSKIFNENDNGGLYFVNKQFQVLNGKIVLVDDKSPLENIQLPAPNLEIKLTQDGQIYKGEAGIEFNFEYNGEIVEPGSYTKTGTFEFYLLPGAYNFYELWAFNEETNEKIKVENMDLKIILDENSNYTGENAYVIDLDNIKEESSNVVISLVYEDGTSLSGYGLPIRGIENSIEEWRKTDKDGKVYLNLEPGLYKIDGYEIDGHWKDLDYKFEVTESHTIDNKLQVVITIKQPNVLGQVLNEDNNPIPNAWVDLEKLPDATKGEFFSEYMGFGANENGEFAINLEEGEYLVKGIWNPNEQIWQEVNIKFYIVNEDGNLELRLTPNGEAVTNLIIQKPQDNVKGYVFKKIDAQTNEGIPFDGRAQYAGEDDDFNQVWLVLREYGISDEEFKEAPWQYEKWIHVKEDGSFSVFLDEAKIYEAFAISTPRKYIELNPDRNNPILIEPPALDLIIIPPKPNFSGQVLDFDGNPIPNAFISIEKADYTQWFGTETDEEGYFGFSLKDGEYIIRDISYRIDDGLDKEEYYYDYSKERRITFNKKIVINDLTDNIVLRPNVKGNLNIGDISITNNDYVGIGIRKILDEQDPNYEDYKENPWKYEIWMDVKYTSGTNAGQFIGYLEDGRYEIIGVSTPGGWKQLGIEFTLNKSDYADIVTYNSGNDTYELNVNYVPNVVGRILDKDGNPEVDAWVNIERIVDEEFNDDGTIAYNSDYYYNRWFSTNTNDNGEFSIKLNDGDYRITGYSTRGYWNENNTWINGKWVSVNYEFKVVNGQLADISSLEIRPNVIGYVKKYNKEAEQFEIVQNSWMRIKPANDNWEVDYDNWMDDKWANSDQNGQFTLVLQPGKYKVVEAGGKDTWMQLNINFEVDNQGNLVENEYVVNGELIVKQQKPNVRGYVKDENGNILANTHIAIKPAGAKEHDWSNVKWIQTDEDGYFELRLDDGNWKVTNISAPGLWQRLYIPFTVEGENISSPVDGVIENGLLQIKPPVPNLVGIVKDLYGNQVTDKAWLTIKPVDAGINDWDNAHWIEYKNYDGEYKFKIYLEPGEYKVVNVYGYNFSYETDIRFTIGQDGTLIDSENIVNGELVVSPPEPNVIGTVTASIDGQEQVLSYGWIGIARYDNEGNQLTLDGLRINEEKYYNADDIYWHYTKWVNVDENGQFSIRLEPGLYKVIAVSGNGIWYKPYTEFTVNEGQQTHVEVKEPGPNVTIIIKNTGLNDQEAWIDIELDKKGTKHYVPVQLKSANNGEYVFETRLRTGDYVIKNFGTPSYWTEIEQEFTVNDEQTQLNIVIDFNNETKKKVIGQVKQNGTSLSGKVWVAIQPVVNGVIDTSVEKRWIQTSEDGTFTFKLDSGTTWAVTDITTSEGYYTINSPLNYSVTVTEDDVQSPSEWIIDLSLLQ